MVALADGDSMTSRSAAARRTGLSVVLWVFGLATTIFLIGMWGRSVSTDESALEDAFRAVAQADGAAQRIEEWIAAALTASAAAADADDTRAAAAISQVTETGGVVDGVVSALVDAALAVPGANPRADVRRALDPLAPVIAARLGPANDAATEALVAEALDRVADIVGATDGRFEIAGTAVDAERVLTRVAVISAAAMLLAAAAAVALSAERVRTARSLATRLAVSGLTFALVLRLGAWAVDPGGGRAPIAAGGAVLLRSNPGVLLVIAALGLALVAALTAVLLLRVKRRRPAEVVAG